MSIQELYQQKRYHECTVACRELLKTDKRARDARRLLIRCLEGLGNYSSALSECDIAIRLHKDAREKTEYLHLKSVILVRDGRLEDAAQSYEGCLSLDPERADTWFLLASCQFELNRFDECERSVVQMLKRAEKVPTGTIGHALYLLTQSRRSLTATALFKRFPQAESTIAAPYYHFALAELHEREKNFARALQHFHEGNRLIQAACGYSIENDLDAIGFYCSLSSKEVATPANDSEPIPIFILGMPRTGSSLLEQMLGSHSGIHPMGELSWLPTAFTQSASALPEPRNRSQIRAACNEQAFLESIRQNYLGNLPEISESFFIDKLPGNFLYTGIIPQIFPGALIIHTQREKAATIWSCYRTPFVDGQGFSHDLSDASTYYDAVEQATKTAGSTVGEGYIAVKYEDLISNPAKVLATVLDQLGLTFEDACLEHTRADRMVSTASRFQVTQPIYGNANEAWKAYESVVSNHL